LQLKNIFLNIENLTEQDTTVRIQDLDGKQTIGLVKLGKI